MKFGKIISTQCFNWTRRGGISAQYFFLGGRVFCRPDEINDPGMINIIGCSAKFPLGIGSLDVTYGQTPMEG